MPHPSRVKRVTDLAGTREGLLAGTLTAPLGDDVGHARDACPEDERQPGRLTAERPNGRTAERPNGRRPGLCPGLLVAGLCGWVCGQPAIWLLPWAR
jgi:hypothetical protein